MDCSSVLEIISTWLFYPAYIVAYRSVSSPVQSCTVLYSPVQSCTVLYAPICGGKNQMEYVKKDTKKIYTSVKDPTECPLFERKKMSFFLKRNYSPSQK